MEFNEWVTKLIDNHKHPVVKYDVKKGKLFHPRNTDDENMQIRERLNSLKRIISSERVERRCARCRLNWLPDQLLAKVEHFCGSKHCFMGYQNKDGKYLFPEEALFLLETNRAEIFWNELPMNIDQAISTLITSPESLNKYLVYRSIALRGCDIRRIEVLDRIAMKINKQTINKNMEETVSNSSELINTSDQLSNDVNNCLDSFEFEKVPVKKMKMDPKFSTKTKDAVDFQAVFTNLQMKGPKRNEQYFEKKCDYGFIMHSNNTNEDQNYSLHFMSDQELDPKIGFYEDVNNVYCCTSKDPVITKFKSVEVPSLL